MMIKMILLNHSKLEMKKEIGFISILVIISNIEKPIVIQDIMVDKMVINSSILNISFPIIFGSIWEMMDFMHNFKVLCLIGIFIWEMVHSL